jgi:hypothetical protein
MKHLLSVLLLVAFVSGIAFGGVGRLGKKQPLRTDDGVAMTVETKAPAAVQHDNSLFKNSAVSWVLVDQAQNPLGKLGWNINPMAYDPSTDVLAMVHRGRTTYAAGSGELWYNVATDPTSWTRVAGLTAGVGANSSRYPSASISNPTKSSDAANIKFVFSAPELVGGAFGGLRYGVDAPIGAAAVQSFFVDTTIYSSQTGIWGSSNSAWVLWVASENDTAGNSYGTACYRTDDYVTIPAGVPPTWLETNYEVSYEYINGCSANGVEYLGMMAQFAGDTLATPNPSFSYDYNLGYSKSTDHGATWSAWVRPQLGADKCWHGIAGFGPNYYIASGNTSSRPNAHLAVDADGHAHFVTVVVDTATSIRSVVEFYETGSGWAGKFIKTGTNPKTIQAFFDVDQACWDLQIATSPDGQILAAFWLDAATSSASDSIPDIWMSSRNLTSSAWSTPVNVTSTPALAELGMHVAPYLKSLGSNQYMAFLSREFEAGNTGALPTSSSTAADIYAGTYTFTQAASAVNDPAGVPAKFELSQNYPNPFNPSTTINYTLANTANVKLTVVNALGQTVATIVNEEKPAGSHTVSFNASNLASGVYFYTLNAGSFTEVRKMMLMK